MGESKFIVWIFIKWDIRRLIENVLVFICERTYLYDVLKTV